MKMIELMVTQPKWTLKLWKSTMDEQLNSWMMYIPGMVRIRLGRSIIFCSQSVAFDCVLLLRCFMFAQCVLQQCIGSTVSMELRYDGVLIAVNISHREYDVLYSAV